MIKTCLLLAVLCTTMNAMAQTVMPLYERIPNSKPMADRETSVTTGGIMRISKVSVPTLTVYRPAKVNDKHAAVIICPGGGYGIIAASHEGVDVARVFNEWGLTAFVLKYRLPDDSTMTDKSIGPLQDAQRAIQLVRENAAVWEIDPGRIGIMGFSAGGHLASTASTHFSVSQIDNPKQTSLRPDFSILIYPVISLSDSLAHMGSRNNLLGKDAGEEKIKAFSNELQVTDKTPPAFLVHAADDGGVKVQNSLVYFQALLRNKVLSELHIYPHGGHGFGLNNKTTADNWAERLKNWMQGNGWL